MAMTTTVSGDADDSDTNKNYENNDDSGEHE